jgi:tellurite resistance protein
MVDAADSKSVACKGVLVRVRPGAPFSFLICALFGAENASTAKSGERPIVQTDADLMLKAMIAVAAADGRLNAREVGLIQDLFEAHTGRSVDISGIVLGIRAYANRRDILTELSIAEGSMSQESKEEIVRAAYRMLIADEHAAKEEFKTLKDIAAALGISDDQLKAIIAATKPLSG